MSINDKNELAIVETLISANPDDYATLTDTTITDEQISDLKALGIAKPPLVNWPRWMGPKDIKQKHELIIHLAASGKTNRQIARDPAIQMDDSRISIIINTPHIKEAIRNKIREYYGDDARAKFRSLADKSFEVFDSILSNPGERANVRLSAAEYIADQTIGKSQQTITLGGNLLIDLITKLDQTPSTEPTTTLASGDYKTLPPVPVIPIAPPRDEVDNFVDTLELEEITIGKRS